MADLRRLLDDGKPFFGTDGVRGVAGSELTPELALEVGRAAGSWLRSGPVLLGRDTRRSGSMLSMALQSGFHAVGIDSIDVGVMPSGAIGHLTATSAATMGAIVSASHNPAGDNGIKLIAATGTKLADEVERELESRIASATWKPAIGSGIGYRQTKADAAEDYLQFLEDTSRYSLRGFKISLDCANGAAYRMAPELFERLGADVEVYGADPDGANINAGCGATHPEYLIERAQGRIGFCFDGDADRLIAIDEDGKVANGDVVMAIVARHLKERGELRKNLVVATVMSNLGFRKAMDEAEIDVVETKVGDRYVSEAMQQRKGDIGGEQSGHIIFGNYAPTGDGLLTTVQLLDVVADTGKELRQLRAEAITELPQVLRNVSTDRMVDLSRADLLWAEVKQVESELGDEGRVLVRPSGTEPVVRIMVEAPSEGSAKMYAERLASATEDSLEVG